MNVKMYFVFYKDELYVTNDLVVIVIPDKKYEHQTKSIQMLPPCGLNYDRPLLELFTSLLVQNKHRSRFDMAQQERPTCK